MQPEHLRVIGAAGKGSDRGVEEWFFKLQRKEKRKKRGIGKGEKGRRLSVKKKREKVLFKR